MKRRQFIQTSAASAIPITLTASGNNLNQDLNAARDLYEIRTYEIKFRGDAAMLINHLKDTLQPALMKLGISHFMLFNEFGDSNPRKIWLLITYPDINVYFQAQLLRSDEDFIKASNKYNKLSVDRAIFNRYGSMLHLAFEGQPQMKAPIENADLFEMRFYEGYNEHAVRRKIKMFNDEEIELFLEVGLHPVFFGDMIVGPYQPCLTYLLNFTDMEERDKNWNTFLQHPAWNKMKGKKKYANTVSNIRRVFLKPI